jgi:hypothetical protein
VATPLVWTYEDAIFRLQEFQRAHATAPSQNQSTLRSCIETALREIVTHDWNCMKRKWRIALVGNQSTGSVTYVPTGGAYPYLCTLTDATVPDWAADASIRITSSAMISEIDQVIDSTSFTLKPPMVPADLCQYTVANSAYTMGRGWYELPYEFMCSWTPAETNLRLLGQYVPFEDWFLMEKYIAWSATTRQWTIGPCPNRLGQMAIYVFPWSQQDEELDLILKMRPRQLQISGHETWNKQGTVTLTQGSATIQGNGTAFRSSMVGSLLRVSIDGTTLPSSTNGQNPYAFVGSIGSYTSATSMTLTAAAPSSFTACKYVVADPIDLDVSLIDAFHRNCEKQLATTYNMKESKDIQLNYQMAFTNAKMADSRIRQVRMVGMSQKYFPRLREFTSRPWIS